jgi:hypothetical protein
MRPGQDLANTDEDGPSPGLLKPQSPQHRKEIRIKNNHTSVPSCLLVLAISLWSIVANGTPARETSQAPTSTSAKSPGTPKCSTSGEEQITITCTYTATPESASIGRHAPRVVLNRAVFSLEPKEECNMLVELTFTNDSSEPISARPTVYLAIDDDQARNYVRRPLPNVDFLKLRPGERQTFSDHLLIGSFRPIRYTIHLWIPDPDPSLKFNPEHDFLLSSVGVGDPVGGLNVLAQFTVKGWRQQHK